MADIKFGSKNLTGINKLEIPLSDGSGTALYVYDDDPLSDKPETMGQRACLAKMKQLRDIKYTTSRKLPVILGGVDNVGYYEPGKTITGMYYSSTRQTDKFVGFNVSLYTFMTAIHNPRSLLYTTTAEENTAENGTNAHTYYGMNCSVFAAYCHGWNYHSATNTIPELPYVEEIDPADMKLCDIAVSDSDHGGTAGHCVMITGITRNEDGTIKSLQISESTRPLAKAVNLSWENFKINYIGGKGYKMYRDHKLYEAAYRASPFIRAYSDEPVEDIVYSCLCTNRGDKVVITSDEDIILNVLLDSGYETIKLHRDGILVGTYSVSGGDIVNGDLHLFGLSVGMYNAILLDADGNALDNAYTSFEVCAVSVTQENNRYIYTGKGCTPVRVVFKRAGGYTVAVFDMTDEEIAKGYKDIEYVTDKVITQVCVPFKSTYGYVVASCGYSEPVEPEESLLPDEYQQVEYIETDGNQYVNTDVMASDYADGIAYTMRGQVTDYLGATNNYFFGCLANSSRSGNISVNKSTDKFCIYLGGASAAAGQIAASGNIVKGSDFAINVKCTSESTHAVCTLNGINVPIAVANITVSTMPSANIYLFTANGVAATNGKFCGKLYSFTMDDAADGTPIRNFVPCYRKSDNVIGLYDTVGGVFYTNAGTGSFTKGEDVA